MGETQLLNLSALDPSSMRSQLTNYSQWGNLLVLAACYESDVLRPHVDADVLRGLFQRTIQFFRLISNETSGLKIDMRILEALDQRLFPDVHRSFSSAMSGPTSMPHPMSGQGPSHPPPPPPPSGEGHFAQPPLPTHGMPMNM